MTFDIENAPSPSVNRKLLAAFAQQRRYLTPEVSDTSLRSNIINNFGVEKKHLFTVGDRDVFAQYSGLEVEYHLVGFSTEHYADSSSWRRSNTDSLAPSIVKRLSPSDRLCRL